MLLTVLLETTGSWSTMAIALSIALVTMGAAFGISKIAATTMESMSRQPEVAPDLRMSMIIAAALIEGVALFAIVVCGFIL